MPINTSELLTIVLSDSDSVDKFNAVLAQDDTLAFEPLTPEAEARLASKIHVNTHGHRLLTAEQSLFLAMHYRLMTRVNDVPAMHLAAVLKKFACHGHPHYLVYLMDFIAAYRRELMKRDQDDIQIYVFNAVVEINRPQPERIKKILLDLCLNTRVLNQEEQIKIYRDSLDHTSLLSTRLISSAEQKFMLGQCRIDQCNDFDGFMFSLLEPKQMQCWRAEQIIDKPMDADIAFLLPDEHGHYTPFGVLYGLRNILYRNHRHVQRSDHLLWLAVNSEQSTGLPLLFVDRSESVYKSVAAILIGYLFDPKINKEAFGRFLVFLQRQNPSLFSFSPDNHAKLSELFNEQLVADFNQIHKIIALRGGNLIREKWRRLSESPCCFLNQGTMISVLLQQHLASFTGITSMAPVYIEFGNRAGLSYIHRYMKSQLEDIKSSAITGRSFVSGDKDPIKTALDALLYLIDMLPESNRLDIASSLTELIKALVSQANQGNHFDGQHLFSVSHYVHLNHLLLLAKPGDSTSKFIIVSLKLLRADMDHQAIYEKILALPDIVNDEAAKSKLSLAWEKRNAKVEDADVVIRRQQVMTIAKKIEQCSQASQVLKEFIKNSLRWRKTEERLVSHSVFVFDQDSVSGNSMYLTRDPLPPEAGQEHWISLPDVILEHNQNVRGPSFKLVGYLSLARLTLPVALALFRHQDFTWTAYQNELSPADFKRLIACVTVFCLLGRDDRIFNLSSNPDYCVLSFKDAFIRLAMMTDLCKDISITSLIRDEMVQAIRDRDINADNLDKKHPNIDVLLPTVPIMPASIKVSRVEKGYQGLAYANLGFILQSAFLTYIEKHGDISNAFYQSTVMNDYSIMSLILFANAYDKSLSYSAQEIESLRTKSKIFALLKVNTLTETTKAQLREKLSQSKQPDQKSAVFALAHIDMESKERDVLIRKHLLNEMITYSDQVAKIIQAMKLLSDEAVNRLKNQINAWAVECQDHKDIVKGLLHAKLEDKSALLFILRVGRTTYLPKQTKHYDYLYRVIINNQVLPQNVASEYGLFNVVSGEEGTELQAMVPAPQLGSSGDQGKAIFKQFLDDHFNGRITWLSEPPFLPVGYPLPASLGLDQWDPSELLSVLSDNLWTHRTIDSRGFILYLLRQRDMPVLRLNKGFNNGRSTLDAPNRLVFAQFDYALLHGKDPRVLAIGRDEAHNLCSYEDLIIKYVLSRVNGDEVRGLGFNPDWVYFHPFFLHFFNQITKLPELFTICMQYAKQSPAIAQAMRDAYLLKRQCPILQELLNSVDETHAKQRVILLNSLKSQPASEPTVQIIAHKINHTVDSKLKKILDIILYIGLTDSYEAIADKMNAMMLTDNTREPLHVTLIINTLKMLSSDEFERLKFRLNQYCYTHKSILNPDALMSNNYADDALPALVLVLKIGRTKFQVEKNGRYYNALCLFMTDKAQTEADKARYGLTEQGPKQPS